MTQEDYPKLTPAEWLKQRESRMDKHSAWVQDGVLKLANNEDPHYTEIFETPEEVERFIAYLLLKADEAWPSVDENGYPLQLGDFYVS